MSRRGALGFVLSVVPLGILAWRLAYVCDDAYIVGRYARHLAGGAGLSFNLDEPAPVEGYSDLLWVLGAAAIEAMGLRSPEVIVWASRAAAVGVLATLGWVLRRQVGVSVSAAIAACVALGALPPFAAWTGSGLETMAAALAMFGLSALAVGEGGALATAGAGLALALLRSEGVAWDAVVLGGVAWARPERRRVLARAGGLLAVALAPVEAWRFATYGTLVPHIARVKVVGGLAALRRGLVYDLLFLLTWLTPGLAFAAGRLRDDPRWPRAAPYLALAVAVAAYAAVVGGDYMPFHRFLLPALPMLAVPLGLWIDRVGERSARRAVALVAGLVLVGGLPLADVHLTPRPLLFALQRAVASRDPGFRSDVWLLDKERERSRARLAWARAVDRVVAPGSSMVARGVGALGYETRLFVLDAYGLVTPEVVDDGRPRMIAPGHDRRVQRGFFMGYVPDVLFALALHRRSRGEILDSLPVQWGLFEDLGPDEAIYVADLVDVPGHDPALPKELVLVRLLREGEDPEAMRERFKDRARALGYRVPPLEPLDARRREVALAKRRGGDDVRELIEAAGHHPGRR